MVGVTHANRAQEHRAPLVLGLPWAQTRLSQGAQVGQAAHPAVQARQAWAQEGHRVGRAGLLAALGVGGQTPRPLSKRGPRELCGSPIRAASSRLHSAAGTARPALGLPRMPGPRGPRFKVERSLPCICSEPYVFSPKKVKGNRFLPLCWRLVLLRVLLCQEESLRLCPQIRAHGLRGLPQMPLPHHPVRERACRPGKDPDGAAGPAPPFLSGNTILP